MHHDGAGVPADRAKAFEWFQRAAGQGHAEAKSRLGVMLD
jgi:TPR repeat protein